MAAPRSLPVPKLLTWVKSSRAAEGGQVDVESLSPS